MQEITGDKEHGDWARKVANEAVSRLYYRGWLRGHACKPYYESIDGVGYLLYALLQLDESQSSAAKPVLDPENW